MKALYWVSEVFAVGARETTWVKWGREGTGEKFEESAILLFLVGVVEHFAVVSGVVGPVLSSPGLVGAAEEPISLAMNSLVGAVVRLR